MKAATMQSERGCGWLRKVLRGGLVALPLFLLECGATREDPTGGETHFFTCETDDDCAWLSSSYTCAAGYCSSDAAPVCSSPAVSANEVLILGDSFFAGSHRITGFLEEQARQAGAIASGERYRDASRLTGNALALTSPALVDQYLAASADGSVKVVIMTGGGADVLLGSCDVIGPTCELLVDATDAARSLFERFASDGVEELVYVFYPDPSEPELRQEVQTLRPLLARACEDSPVPCHWVDLRESFAGQEEELLDPTGTSPTTAGSQAAARQIWAVMQAQCVAQPP